MKFSVIVPAHNSQTTIVETLQSVLVQSYADFEIIVIDDGSTDGTKLLVEGVVAQDARVRLVANDRAKGAAGARNTGILAAEGQYVCFLDSDDIWYPSRLMLLAEEALKEPSLCFYSDYDFIGENSKVLKHISAPKRVDLKSMLRLCGVGCLTVAIPRHILVENLFSETCPKEDYELWLRLMFNGVRFRKIDYNCGGYRIQRGSLSSNKVIEFRRQWYVVGLYETRFSVRVWNMFCYATHGVLRHYFK